MIPIALPHTPEWYSARTTGIGASEAAAACGLSKHESPLHLWARKRGLIEDTPDKESATAMRLGLKLEPIVKSEFCEATGMRLLNANPPMFRDNECPFILATPDAIINPYTLLECKTVGWRTAEDLGPDGTDEVPNAWVIQAQQQMLVCNATTCHIACLVDGRQLRLFVVQRNERLIAFLIQRLKALWGMIESGEHPPPDWEDPAEPETVKALFAVDETRFVELDEDAEWMWRRQAKIQRLVTSLEKQREVLRAKVAIQIGEASVAKLPSGLEIVRSVVEGGSVNYERKPYTTMRQRKAK